jgi:cellulose synthase/poly-beta-1,6-N-acetylglucosamine synthase-like glycosyltransferase
MLSLLLTLLTFFYLRLIISWLTGWLKIPVFKAVQKTARTKITVIVPARNEENNILSCLNDLLAQTYPKELTGIIIADDHSEDSTAEKVNSFIAAQKNGSHIRLIRMQDFPSAVSYKKNAIKTAIDAAKGELIVTTDADCRMGKDWLLSIAAYYEQYRPQLISGPVTFIKQPSFFAGWQTLEFASLIGIGAASIANNMHSMCNGANIAYRRTAFYEVDGFSGNENIPSGDDEFLMHKIAGRYPRGVHFIKAEEAIVYTSARGKPGVIPATTQKMGFKKQALPGQKNNAAAGAGLSL